uniref:Uncharacterized protein n=1 Tax=Myotis myotis TaxID=51298 RepID=A0A7J7ZY07_MYOMY|nr:hypothetical protein mMyoMyo1_009868 [Myotis myotis]
MLDLSVTSRSPISQIGVHPENSQEVNKEPGNQPRTSDVVWGQELTFPVNMAADQAFSDDHGHPPGQPGLGAATGRTPQGYLTEEQHLDSKRCTCSSEPSNTGGHRPPPALAHNVCAPPSLAQAGCAHQEADLDKLLLEKFMIRMPLAL